MSPDAGWEPRAGVLSDPINVRVEYNALGWRVTLPDRSRRVTCATINDARRIAYLCDAHTRPCELIVQSRLRARKGERSNAIGLGTMDAIRTPTDAVSACEPLIATECALRP